MNPRFGLAADLKTLVDTAHANGMRVILDIILNHTGNVFGYAPDRYLTTDRNGLCVRSSEGRRAGLGT